MLTSKYSGWRWVVAKIADIGPHGAPQYFFQKKNLERSNYCTPRHINATKFINEQSANEFLTRWESYFWPPICFWWHFSPIDIEWIYIRTYSGLFDGTSDFRFETLHMLHFHFVHFDRCWQVFETFVAEVLVWFCPLSSFPFHEYVAWGQLIDFSFGLSSALRRQNCSNKQQRFLLH